MKVRDKVTLINRMSPCHGCGGILSATGPIYVEDKDLFATHARCLTKVPNDKSYSYLPLDVILEIDGMYERLMEKHDSSRTKN